jgi:hypothetical protein
MTKRDIVREAVEGAEASPELSDNEKRVAEGIANTIKVMDTQFLAPFDTKSPDKPQLTKVVIGNGDVIDETLVFMTSKDDGEVLELDLGGAQAGDVHLSHFIDIPKTWEGNSGDGVSEGDIALLQRGMRNDIPTLREVLRGDNNTCVTKMLGIVAALGEKFQSVSPEVKEGVIDGIKTAIETLPVKQPIVLAVDPGASPEVRRVLDFTSIKHANIVIVDSYTGHPVGGGAVPLLEDHNPEDIVKRLQDDLPYPVIEPDVTKYSQRDRRALKKAKKAKLRRDPSTRWRT